MLRRDSVFRLKLTEPNYYRRRINLQRSHIETRRMLADCSFYVETERAKQLNTPGRPTKPAC